MSELKRHHINEVMDMHYLTKGELGYSYVYYADDVDKVIEEKDKEIADLIEKNKRLARKDIIMASETIKDLEESHKMEVEQLLMEIVELKEKYKELAKLHDKAIQACCDADKVIAHHKYKRCLAMARLCERKRVDAANYRIPRGKWEFYDKWHKRWLEIADQFKEAK